MLRIFVSIEGNLTGITRSSCSTPFWTVFPSEPMLGKAEVEVDRSRCF